MQFSMPYLPQVSVNHAHLNHRHTGRPIRHPDLQKWMMVLTQKVRTWADETGAKLEPGKTVVIWLDAKFPQQRGTKPNGDNFLKYATDAIAAGLGTDDDIYPFLPRVRTVAYNQPDSELSYEVITNVDPEEN